MTSYATRRLSRRTEIDLFPALPTLGVSQSCDGLAFVAGKNMAAPKLRPLRDRIAAIWKGRLEEAEGAPHVLVLTFTEATDASAFPAALPLIAQAGTLTSFAGGAQRPGAPRREQPAGMRNLELFWGGRRHRLALDSLEPVEIAALWDLPDIVVHPALPPPVARAAHGIPKTAAANMRGRVMRVSRGRTPFAGIKGDPLGEVDKRLRALEERTTLSALLRQAVGLLSRSAGFGAGPREGSGGAGDQRVRGPGLLANLVGWIRWHTPLGAGLGRQYEERLKLVERLVAKGDIDAALKLALRLGAGKEADKPRTLYPNSLPRARARLDFEVEEGFTSPIIGGGGFLQLQGRYLQLAQDLRLRGDFRRAAYIHSKLLGDHHSAVLALEAGGHFAEAASLAIKSRQPPAVAIRMLYQSGDRGAAFALARRASCFDELVEDSRKRDPAFHSEVVKAWTDDLVATGQPLRALQVTDHLTGKWEGAEALIAARKDWIASALEAEERDGFRAETAVRALLMASWTRADIPAEDACDFPEIDPSRASPAFAGVLHWLQAVVRGETSDGRDTMLELLAAFVRLAAVEGQEQARFWAGPAQPVAEGFGRSLIGIASNGLDQADMQALQSLLHKANLHVLALDIGRLRTLHASPPEAVDGWQLPAPSGVRPRVQAGCLLGNGNVLLWRKSNVLQLLDRHGTLLWQRPMRDVVALVPIGRSPNVIIVQRDWEGSSRLTRFASHDRSVHAIGVVDLVAHHDTTSESQWLVQIGGEIGALDLVKLCAPAPAVEFVWSCGLTSNVRALAFADGRPDMPSWLTCDVGHARYGIVELWNLRNGSDLRASICLPPSRDRDEIVPPQQWWWLAEGTDNRIGAVAVNGVSMTIMPWSDEAERQALSFAARRRAAGFDGVDEFQPCDANRAWVRRVDASDASPAMAGEIRIEDPYATVPAFRVRHEGALELAAIARGAAPREPSRNRRSGGGSRSMRALGPVLLADEHGRTFLIEPSRRRATTL